ncbi:methyltransferase domain-containing protein [Nocardioides mangrovicus]|uniref:Methyltransferase domain-containing protein n=1 Tax=Nocardioides mangrovicus TaxID=2478913 RepID=A0A3L8P4L8_9ACTN|nr:methyltransferase domain-containing protein [Nocardioides mangrovicus]RLV49683.1 methyltransferase domain-containing protein [Nocardioides mangrovicus]
MSDLRDPRDPRTQSFWDLHDFGSGRGIEVGPLFRPLVRREEADVRYLDIADRESLVETYREHVGIPVDDIVDVDFPMTVDGVVISMAQAVGSHGPFDWVVASHVIEHVPDVIGWLADLAELTVDGGSVVLAVPDKRYSFDLHRPSTTVGAMLQAHLDQDVVPSVRAVYDHHREAVAATSTDLWAGALPGFEARIHDSSYVNDQVAQAAQVYTDCHVWVFSEQQFLSQMSELRDLGLSHWYVDRFLPTAPNQLEFLVRLRRVPRGADAAAWEAEQEVRSTETRPDWMAWRQDAAEVDQLRKKVQRQGDRIDRQRQRIERQRARIERLQTRLNASPRSRRLQPNLLSKAGRRALSPLRRALTRRPS